MPGSGPDQQYLAYQTFAHEIDYDLLVISNLVATICASRGTISPWEPRTAAL